MTTYKETFGTNIEAVSSDPANPVEGQVWYNLTDNVVKSFALTAAGAWASGGNLNTARVFLAGAGTQTSAWNELDRSCRFKYSKICFGRSWCK